MPNLDFTDGLTFFNDQTIRWGSRIEKLLKEWQPIKEIEGECLTLIWGEVKFFGSVLSVRSIFFPEETLVKDRHLHEMILIGNIEPKKYAEITKGIITVIGDPTGHLDLANLSSYNWMHDDIEVSTNYMTNTKVLKVVIRK